METWERKNSLSILYDPGVFGTLLNYLTLILSVLHPSLCGIKSRWVSSLLCLFALPIFSLLVIDGPPSRKEGSFYIVSSNWIRKLKCCLSWMLWRNPMTYTYLFPANSKEGDVEELAAHSCNLLTPETLPIICILSQLWNAFIGLKNIYDWWDIWERKI